MTPEEQQAMMAQQAAQKAAPPPATDPNAPPPADPNAPPSDEQQSNEAPSVQVSKAVYTSIKNLLGNLKAADNTYENPEAKDYFNGPFMDKANEMQSEIKGLISKLGANVDDGDAEDDPSQGGDSGVDEDQEAMKSFLVMGNTNDLKLLGYIAPLNSLSRAKNLTDEQRLCLGGVLKSIRGLCDEARKNSEEAKKKALATQVASLQENYGGLTKSIADLQSQMGQLLPSR